MVGGAASVPEPGARFVRVHVAAGHAQNTAMPALNERLGYRPVRTRLLTADPAAR